MRQSASDLDTVADSSVHELHRHGEHAADETTRSSVAVIETYIHILSTALGETLRANVLTTLNRQVIRSLECLRHSGRHGHRAHGLAGQAQHSSITREAGVAGSVGLITVANADLVLTIWELISRRLHIHQNTVRSGSGKLKGRTPSEQVVTL